MKPWRIQYFGEFTIWDSAGHVVSGVPVKALALLGILHLSRPYGLSRLELGRVLWPESSAAKQLASLRSSLFCLRKVLPAGQLVVNRQQCLLTPDFEIESDTSSPGSLPFMPGYEGSWFDLMRIELEQDVAPVSMFGADNVSQSYVNLLTWYAHQNPAQMLDAMRASFDLTVDLPPSQIKELLAVAGRQLGSAANGLPWMKFWCGWLKEHERIGKGELLLEEALRQGLEQQDFVLATEAFQYLLAAYILQDRPDKAGALSALPEGALRRHAGSTGVQVATANYHSHMGHHSAAVVSLVECLSSLAPNDYRRLRVEALLAFYEACQGRVDHAEYLNARVREEGRSTGNFRLAMISTLADAHISMGRGLYSVAAGQFKGVVDRASVAFSQHFVVYGHEGLAASYLLAGDSGRSTASFANAKDLRAKTNMPYTRWDRQRLGRAVHRPV